MSRLMSCALTVGGVIDRTKTVTRRLGWRFLKPGDTLTLCRKVMGRRRGDPLERLAEVRVVGVRREPLNWIGQEDVVREGFPSASPLWFVDMFCEEMRVSPETMVTRIEWEYLDGEGET